MHGRDQKINKKGVPVDKCTSVMRYQLPAKEPNAHTCAFTMDAPLGPPAMVPRIQLRPYPFSTPTLIFLPTVRWRTFTSPFRRRSSSTLVPG